MSIFNKKSKKTAGLLSILAVFTLIIILSTQSSCSKSGACSLKADFTPDKNTTQNAAMVAFCTANNISYTTDESGILYQIITPGSSTHPNLCETLSMTYTGTLLNGTKFDSGTISNYSLGQLIPGWQIAVPKIGKGGHIKVLIPSSLAYGAQAVGSIPANSPLYFDIVLN